MLDEPAKTTLQDIEPDFTKQMANKINKDRKLAVNNAALEFLNAGITTEAALIAVFEEGFKSAWECLDGERIKADVYDECTNELNQYVCRGELPDSVIAAVKVLLSSFKPVEK